MKKFYGLLSVLFLFVLSAAQAQEICDNGIDDDGDGFVDCYDGSCADDAACDGFFLSEESDCQAYPTEFPEFKMKLMWASDDETTSSYGRASVGDLDSDGIPEIVTANQFTQKVHILSGQTGQTLETINLDFGPTDEVTLADIDRDGYVEIFVPSANGSKTIQAFRYNIGSGKYESLWKAKSHSPAFSILGVADFKETGKAQIYLYNEILDAETGTVLVEGTGNWAKDITMAPVAVDILDDSECGNCAGLELVSGGTIYAVNLGNGTAGNGSLTAVKTMSETGTTYYPKSSVWNRNYSSTSVADYNADGYLDVISTGATGNGKGASTVFFWDVQNGTTQTYSDPDNDWQNGTGRLNIADLDGNGALNVSYVSGSYLYALDENFNRLWRKSITEGTSGFTGCTVFDFNGDGAYETVYRSEEYLYIINGTDGSDYRTIPCVSRTAVEYPVVADIDGDGATEICVACNTDDDTDIYQNWRLARYSQIRAFESDGENWVPARRVWNQHAYFNVNINDNMSVPIEVQKHNIGFTGGRCDDGTVRRPLNTFLNQSPFLDINGCPIYGAADFNIVDNSFKITQPTCPETDFTVSFSVRNDGDVVVNGSVPFSFYNGDPFDENSLWLGTQTVEVKGMKPGDVIKLTDISVTGPGSPFQLYLSFNDEGMTPPISLPNGGILECSTDENIVNTAVIPGPFPVEVEVVKDHETCGPDAQGNGELKAYVLQDGNQITEGYEFNWYAGSDDTGNHLGTGAVLSNRKDGTYTVVATHVAANCYSSASQGVVGTTTPTLALSLNTNANQTNCVSPNGSQEVSGITRNGASDELDNYSFEWYRTDDPSTILSVESSLNTMAADVSYTVKATHKFSDCEVTATGGNLSDETTTYTLQVDETSAISCSNSKGSATVSTPGSSGLQIRWYQGYTVEDAKEITALRGEFAATNLAEGVYSIVAINTDTGCRSNQALAEIIDARTDITIEGDITANDACDASVATGGISLTSPEPFGLTFSWYEGTGTSGTQIDDAKISENGSLENVLDGDYTLVVFNSTNDCSETAYFTVGNEQKTTTIGTANYTATPNTVCTPTSSLPYNGQIEISSLNINGAEETDLGSYTFRWYAGNSASGTPLENETSAVLDELAAGTYTVVAENNTSKCTSNTQTIQVGDATAEPELKLTATPQQSCDNSQPNGSIQATDEGDNPIDASAYSIDWYVGNGTGTALAAANVNGFEAINLAGNTRYTAVLTNLATNCTATQTILVTENKVIPTVSLTANQMNGCTMDGSLVASLNGGLDASEYDFIWYKGIGTGGEEITTETSATLSGLGGNPLPAGDYTVIAVHTTNHCESQPQTARLEAPDPAFDISTDLTVFASDCNGTGSGTPGTIEAYIGTPGNTAGYSFRWYEGTPENLPANFYTEPAIAFGTELSTTYSLSAGQGTYTVVATETATGCKAFATADILTAETPVIDDTQLAVTPIKACDLNSLPALKGKVSVELVSGNNTQNIFYLAPGQGYADLDAISAAAIAPTYGASNASGPVEFDVSEPGIYTLAVAENQSSQNCYVTRTVEVEKESLPPIITELSVTADTDCSAAGLGTLSATVTPGPGDNIATTYAYAVLDSNGDPVETKTGQGTTASFSNLDAGTYSLQVTAEETLCDITQEFTIDAQAFTGELIVATAENNINCDPQNGVIELSANTYDISTDYDFNWYTRAAYDAGEPAFDGNSNEYIKSNLSAGEYVIVATVDRSGTAGNGCELSPVYVRLGDDRSLPVLSLTATNRTDCGPANGSLLAQVSNPGFEPSAGYTFSWFKLDASGNETTHGGTVNTISGSEQALADLEHGQYRVRVINPETGCSVEQDISLYDNRQYPTLSLAITDQPDCNYGGAIEVSGISPDEMDDYTFSWYRADVNSSPVYTGGPVLDISTYDVIEADVYYVVATHNTTSCYNGALMARIERTASDPEISLTEAVANTSCEAPNGSLTVDAFGGSGPYTYAWYQGTSLLANDAQLSGYGAGTYRVEVTDASNCTQEASFTITDDPHVAEIATSTVPLSVCADGVDYLNNGLALASIANPHSSIRYEFHWFNGNLSSYPGTATVGSNGMLGTTANGQPLENLSAGEYTVFAVETTGNRNCPIVGKQLTIEDVTQSPAAQVEEIAAMTNCDISRPNGQLSASVDGSSTNYRFEWFLDSTGERLGQGSTLSKLNAGVDYRLVVTNLLSGCQTSSIHQVSENTVNPVLDPAEVVAVPQTNCQIGNGSLSASVNGNTASYDFLWYRMNDQNQPVAISGHTGPVLDDLEAGNYQVQVRNRNTGCLSNLADATISLELSYPEVEVKVMPGTCNGLEDGQARLSGNNILRNEWFDGSGRLIATNAIILDLPVGKDYSVVAYNQYDCPTTFTFDVGTEITPYNAVTPNADGYNDFFIIECIEEFPNNEVKVYNRAGTLVYAIDGYNNQDKAFEGVGNKGVYPMQNKLPDGTYYYVVDKKAEGEEPVSGFLELKR